MPGAMSDLGTLEVADPGNCNRSLEMVITRPELRNVGV